MLNEEERSKAVYAQLGGNEGQGLFRSGMKKGRGGRNEEASGYIRQTAGNSLNITNANANTITVNGNTRQGKAR